MNDGVLQVVFYLFAGLAILSAFMVVTQTNSVRSVLFLVLTFFASAVLWMMLGAEFLSLILVLVYVGAVMTLFLFVIMMLNIEVESNNTRYLRYVPFGLIAVAFLVGLLLKVIPFPLFSASIDLPTLVAEAVRHAVVSDVMPAIKSPSNTEALGLVLYTDYVFAFELAAAILLVAIIAAITLVHRNPIRSKRQNSVRQMMTDPRDRITLVPMASEK